MYYIGCTSSSRNDHICCTAILAYDFNFLLTISISSFLEPEALDLTTHYAELQKLVNSKSPVHFGTTSPFINRSSLLPPMPSETHQTALGEHALAHRILRWQEGEDAAEHALREVADAALRVRRPRALR